MVRTWRLSDLEMQSGSSGHASWLDRMLVGMRDPRSGPPDAEKRHCHGGGDRPASLRCSWTALAGVTGTYGGGCSMTRHFQISSRRDQSHVTSGGAVVARHRRDAKYARPTGFWCCRGRPGIVAAHGGNSGGFELFRRPLCRRLIFGLSAAEKSMWSTHWPATQIRQAHFVRRHA